MSSKGDLVVSGVEKNPKLGKDFSVLWAVSMASTLGDGIRLAAFPLMAAAISSDPRVVALVAFSGQLPWLLVSLISGAVGDRRDRKTIMWASDAFRAVAVLGLVVIIATAGATIPALCVTAFLLGVGQTFFDTSAQAMIPAVVSRENLASANSRIMTARMLISTFIGPPLGSLLFAIGMVLPFLANSGTFLLAAVLVGIGLKAPGKPKPTTNRTLWSDISQGVIWLARHSVVRNISALITVVNFTQALTQSVLVLYVLQILGLGQSAYGLILAASGVGALLGGVLGSQLRRHIPAHMLFIICIFLTVPVFAILALTSNAYVACLVLALNAFGGITANILLQSLRQMIVPDAMMSRVNSIIGLTAMGIGLPLGSLAGGFIADAWGIRAPFWVAAAIISVSCIAVPNVARSLARHNSDLRR
ncbi:MFS transporter [Nocardiopsis dassonvillei]|uniref:MFS transporter n=1 Tax=Nocardiopsis dassonvillei TaxID=2014 RepID=UPI003672D30E